MTHMKDRAGTSPAGRPQQDYWHLYRQLEKTIREIEESSQTGSALSVILESLVNQYHDSLGIEGGRIYRRDAGVYVLETMVGHCRRGVAHAEAGPGYEIPLSYPVIRDLRERHILITDHSNPDFDPAKEDFMTWGGGIAKTWHLPKFFKVGAEIEFVDGERLDRFSKYQFGPFSDVRVRGYRSQLVRAEQAWATHLSYGFNLGEVFQLNLLGDVAWATDEATGLDNEMLAGIGIAGNFVGPWSTIINVDVGKAVAGPDDGFTALIAVLKLFN